MHRPHRDLLARRAERLVISGYRNMMAAYELGDCACWDAIWNAYGDELGSRAARRLVGEIQYWVRALQTNSSRPLGYSADNCLQLCEDECIVLSLVAAAQRCDGEAGSLAVSLLTGTRQPARIGEVWQASSHLGAALKCAGQEMHACPRSVIAQIGAGCLPPHAAQPAGAFN